MFYLQTDAQSEYLLFDERAVFSLPVVIPVCVSLLFGLWTDGIDVADTLWCTVAVLASTCLLSMLPRLRQAELTARKRWVRLNRGKLLELKIAGAKAASYAEQRTVAAALAGGDGLSAEDVTTLSTWRIPWEALSLAAPLGTGGCPAVAVAG